uniref:Uncharacterized protein n=1 Tax=Brassica campestris TaxID=3711 RepID=M4E4G9_BRACM
MVTQTTVLAVTDDVVLNVSSVLTIMKELGKEGIGCCDPIVITQASTISQVPLESSSVDTITAKKSSWKIGSSFALKKPSKTLLKVNLDDDLDLIDEDSLLTDEELKKPQLPAKEVKERWRQALKDVAGIAGYDFSNSRLINLEVLYLGGCLSLKALSVFSSLEKLSGCSSLKELRLTRTAIEEVPSLMRTWSCLYELDMSDCRNLKEFPNVPDSIVELVLCTTRIEEVPAWIGNLSRLRKLIMYGCMKLKTISPNISKLENLEPRKRNSF